MVGVDDLNGENFRLVPRLPATMTRLTAENVPVTVQGKACRIGYSYSRDGQGDVTVSDGVTAYGVTYQGEVKPQWMRVGPFDNADITASAKLLRVACIQGRYYAYITLE